MAVGACAIEAAFASDVTSAAGFDRRGASSGRTVPDIALAVPTIGLLLAIYGVVCALSAPFRSTS
jgi:hypothetical protein